MAVVRAFIDLGFPEVGLPFPCLLSEPCLRVIVIETGACGITHICEARGESK
jgi:hypothetical protein